MGTWGTGKREGIERERERGNRGKEEKWKRGREKMKNKGDEREGARKMEE